MALIHNMAAMILSSSLRNNFLGMHMLHTSATAGLPQAVVSLMSILSDPSTGAPPQGDRFAHLRRRFRELVREGKDADALTVEAWSMARRGQHGRAVDVLKRALAIGTESNDAAPRRSGDGESRGVDETGAEQASARGKAPGARFGYQVLCYQTLHDCLRQLGRAEEARAVLEKSALECDDPAAYDALWRLTPRDEPAWEGYALRAAVNGSADACSALAELEMQNSTRAGQAMSEAHHVKLSEEWRRLAGI